MSPRLVDPDTDICPLPQCGFGADIHFDSLIASNPFVYRVYTPKERSPFEDDTDPFFIAPRFDEQFTRSPVDLPKVKFFEPLIGSYADVAQHMDWTTRMSSCYVSTSFNFGWAIWEAVRRYHQGVKKDVEIAIIDANALGGRAATAMQLLQKSSLEERTDQFWKWYRFSQDSQCVLVYGMIPRTAVLASIPLLQILRKLPSYFLRQDTHTTLGNPLNQVAWNYALRKQNYRNFCQEMSNLFLGRPVDIRLRDSTAGAVRLALGFLRPFFHHVVQDDFDVAIAYLRNLAISISIWPGGHWAEDHPEIRQIIETMILAIGEELKEKYFSQKQGEIERLQLVIDGLQQTIQLQGEKSRLVIENMEVDSDGEGEFDLVLAESEEPTLVATDLAKILRRPPSLEMSVTVIPKIPVTFQTPITPPESPRNSLFLHTATTTLPHGVVLSPMSISFGPASEDTQIEEASEIPSNKNTPISEEPASPPPTPPAVSSDVSFLPLPPLEDSVTSAEEEQEQVERYSEERKMEQIVHEASNEVSEPNLKSHDEYQTFPTDPVELAQDAEQVELEDDTDLAVQEHDDGEETELELEQEEEHYDPPSPIDSWVRVRPKFSSFSSMSSASSITSVETLCEPADFPAKRVSLVADDSFEIVPPFAGFRSLGVASRTISFSEPEPSPKLVYQPLPLPFVKGALDVPLPPSPSVSSESISPLDSRTSTVSRTSTPSPPSPTLPSLSPQSSCPSTPRPSSPLELHTPHTASTSAIIPPRQHISLLSPLPLAAAGVEGEDKDRPRATRNTRSTVIVDAASYAVTGFLIGAFITLFLFSTQRKTLMVLT